VISGFQLIPTSHDEGHEVQVFSPLMRGNVISRGLPLGVSPHAWGHVRIVHSLRLAAWSYAKITPFASAANHSRPPYPLPIIPTYSMQVPLRPSSHSMNASSASYGGQQQATAQVQTGSSWHLPRSGSKKSNFGS
jgi:hypothetical protein